MKIIVQCAGRKDRMAGSFLFSGKKVKFVSRPEIAALEEATDFSYFRPDDVGDIGSGLVSDSAEKPSYAFFLFGLGRWRVSHSL